MTTDTLTPTHFQLWLVQRTGVSVADQEALTLDEWMNVFGKLALTYDGPITDEFGVAETFVCDGCGDSFDERNALDSNFLCWHCSGDEARDFAEQLMIDIKRDK